MRKPRPDLYDPDHKRTQSPEPEDVNLSGTVPIKSKPASDRSKAERTFERTEDRTEDRSEHGANFRSVDRTAIRTKNRSVSLPTKRLTKRYSFEFFEDQLTSIKKIKIETELSGENISLSEIVRRAIDEYLDKIEETVRNSARNIDQTNYRTEERTE